MKRTNSVSSRRGVILAAVLITLAIAAALLLALVQAAVVRRSAAEVAAWRTQAALLAESAMERAAVRLAADPSYRGETWNIPADASASWKGAVVVIRAETPAGKPDTRRVSVCADYPNDPLHRARRELDRTIILPSKEPQS